MTASNSAPRLGTKIVIRLTSKGENTLWNHYFSSPNANPNDSPLTSVVAVAVLYAFDQGFFMRFPWSLDNNVHVIRSRRVLFPAENWRVLRKRGMRTWGWNRRYAICINALQQNMPLSNVNKCIYCQFFIPATSYKEVNIFTTLFSRSLTTVKTRHGHRIRTSGNDCEFKFLVIKCGSKIFRLETFFLIFSLCAVYFPLNNYPSRLHK